MIVNFCDSLLLFICCYVCLNKLDFGVIVSSAFTESELADHLMSHSCLTLKKYVVLLQV